MKVIFTILILMTATFAYGGDYEDGMAAIQNKDYVTAAKKFKLASDRGDTKAKFELSMLLRSGKSGEVNRQESFKLLKQAAELGYPKALYWLGNSYSTGFYPEYREGLSDLQRKEMAFKLFKSAAEKGNPDAQTMVGRYYNGGDDDIKLLKNYKEALRWYKLAADQGDADGQGLLGTMYEEGHGVLQNYSEAVRLYKLAAEQGDRFGQIKLGYLYYDGIAVKKNLVLSHMYFNLAAANENSFSFNQEADAKQRNLIEKLMNSQEITLAQKLASECLARKYKNCGV